MTELLEVTVGAPAHGGHCVARYDGRVIFVRHALPGETVRIKVTEAGDDARFWRADAVEIITPSPDRVVPAWPQAGPGGVGGAELSHASLSAQRAWKQAVLEESFERFARTKFPGHVHAAPGDEQSLAGGYRTRVTAVAGADGKAGMYGHRSRELHPLTEMPLALDTVEQALLDNKFPAGARINVVQPSAGPLRMSVDGQPWRSGKVDTRDNAPRYVRETVTVGERTWNYRVDIDGFWQVHREAPALLVEQVLGLVNDAPRVADLYAGAGLFSLPLADGGREVIAVEADGAAARAARRNAHDVPSLTTVQGDVRATLNKGIGPVEAIVLDPPRSGAGAKTLSAIAQTGASRLVYVACDPVALARDTAILTDLGFALTHAEAYDLFPHTHHVETIAAFDRI